MTNKKKAYLVKSQEAYHKLMKELEEKGYLWRTGEKPTEADSSLAYAPYYPSEICIYLDDKEISCSGDKFFTKYYFKDYELIEYPEPSDCPGKEWTGKLELSYVPSQIIRDIAEVRMYENDKYKEPDSWKVVPTKQWIDALYHHMLEFVDNPNGVDSESGIPHYKHMACNLAFICEQMKEDEDVVSKMIKNGEYSIARVLADNFKEWRLERLKMEGRNDELY